MILFYFVAAMSLSCILSGIFIIRHYEYHVDNKTADVNLYMPTVSRPLPPNPNDLPIYRLSADLEYNEVFYLVATWDIGLAISKFRKAYNLPEKHHIDVKWVAGRQPIRRFGNDRLSLNPYNRTKK